MLDRIDEDDNEHDEDPDAADDIVITFTYRSSCCGKACRLVHMLALPCQVVQYPPPILWQARFTTLFFLIASSKMHKFKT